MLIIAIIVFGLLAGGLAQLVLGRSMATIDWTMALAAGLLGSFIGGTGSSLLSGDGLRLRPSGIIGSVLGALLVTAAVTTWRRRTP